jgi:hypothetical protein
VAKGRGEAKSTPAWKNGRHPDIKRHRPTVRIHGQGSATPSPFDSNIKWFDDFIPAIGFRLNRGRLIQYPVLQQERGRAPSAEQTHGRYGQRSRKKRAPTYVCRFNIKVDGATATDTRPLRRRAV